MNRPSRSTAARALPALALPALLLAAAGCGEKFDTSYGKRRGSDSVAGTAALGSLFEQAGNRVSSWGRISPKLDDYDVIVWAPDNFLPPTLEQRAALEEWLAPPHRTLVYIGRDFDALSAYWRAVLPDTPPNDWVGTQKRLAQARARHVTRRSAMPQSAYARWFTVKRGDAPRKVTAVQPQDPEWYLGIDASKLDIIVEGRIREAKQSDAPKATPSAPLALDSDLRDLEQQRRDGIPAQGWDVLLDSNVGPLVARVTDRYRFGGQVLVVPNGSFLLNLPLVNHEHRKLAQQLVRQCGAAGDVVFLESGPDGPRVYETELDEGAPTGLELFTVWPIGLPMIHLLVIGVLACFVMFPTFGRARTTPADDDSSPDGSGQPAAPRSGHTDFGRHIEAVGELLARTNGHQYAVSRLQHYHQAVKRDSGVSHAPPPSDRGGDSDPQKAPD